MTLWEKGYSFDYVSDRFLSKAECKDHKILLGGNEYQAVVVPECSVIPVATLDGLISLAKGGATIIFQNHLPTDVPGLTDLERRRAALREIGGKIKWLNREQPLQESAIGEGHLIVTPSVEPPIKFTHVKREPAVESGLRFVRRKFPEGFIYFFANRS